MPNMHLFPYHKIPAGSSILLYGAGLVGKCYMDQIAATAYCSILFCFDRNSGGSYRGIPIMSPADIKDYTGPFDYMVIAMGATGKRLDEVAQFLLSSGIPAKKIIHEDIYAEISGVALRCQGEGQLYGSYSYAQHGDDLMVINIFTLLGISRPSYLDVGAHHPWNISNTALLYERGSRGINVEANPDLITAFYEERPEDKNVCCGVAGQNGFMPFYIVAQGTGENGFDKNLIEAHHLTIVDSVLLPVKTLDDIINEYAGGIFPDYLTIDVEGLEYEVLSACNLKENGPKVISVELNDIRVRELLNSMGYFPYCSTGGNLICVRQEYRTRLYCAWPEWHNGGE